MLALANDDQRLNLFSRIWAISAIALLATTWKLWLPADGFPQIPVAAMFGKLPEWADWLTFGAMIVSLLLVVLRATTSRYRNLGLLAFAGSLALSIFINQHRFQPWAYQFLVIAVVLATARPGSALRLLRWLTIGIYLWSAWSKCDFTFAHNLGQQLLKALLGWSGFEGWSPNVRLVLVGLVPLAELAIAAGLCFRRFWPSFVWASLAFHLLLLIALGPLGMHHKPGVLIWNAYFIAQNLILFRKASGNAYPAETARLPWTFANVLIGVLLAWPFLERWNYCDHWPAWSVYSPRVERIAFYVHQSEQDRLPKSLQKFLETSAEDGRWRQLRLDRWSLMALDVPLYPQNRFQIAIAEAVARRFGLSQSRVVAFSSANRWTGARTSQVSSGLGQIEQATTGFVLGSRSVRNWNSD